jgi:hypothetical protein
MRVVPRYRRLNQAIPRRLRWTRSRTPSARYVAIPHRPVGRKIERPSARVSLMHLVATLCVAVILWGISTFVQSIYAGRIYPHVTIDHVPVGGMNRAEALAALRYSESERINSTIYVQVAGKTWKVTPAQFGARYDVASAVDRAIALAHGGQFLLGGWDEFQTIWRGANVPLTGTHSPDAVSRFLDGIARAVHVAPRSASVGIQNDDVVILRHSVDGWELDKAGAEATLGAVINTHDATAVSLQRAPVRSALSDVEANQAVGRAELLLSAPIRFQYQDLPGSPQWVLTREGTLRLLTFAPRCGQTSCRFEMGIDLHKLSQAFNTGKPSVAQTIDRAPLPAYYSLYGYGAGDVSQVRVVAQPDIPGQTIDVPAAAAGILQQADITSTQRTVTLGTLTLHPTFTFTDAVGLGFQGLPPVGHGSAYFDPQYVDWARRDNVNVAANVISGTIVQAGKPFSLSLQAGPLDANSGYLAGQNDVGPHDITGANGGVTLFASAVLAGAYDAGLSIEQRVHYPYLNAFIPPGLDAVVSYDEKKKVADLTFRNTTDHSILVMTHNDGQGRVDVFIFNGAGFAPQHKHGSYSSQADVPQLTLNADGSVDTTIVRHMTINGQTTQDSLTSHYTPIDP